MRSKLAFALLFAIPTWAGAASAKPVSPLDRVQSFRGAVEVGTEGGTVEVIVREAGGASHFFRAETSGHESLPLAWRAESGKVLFWRGHLVVIAPQEGLALHLSVPEPALPARPGPPAAPLPDSHALDASLRASYDLTRIATATGIVSRSGPLALAPDRRPASKLFESNIDYDDPGSGGGSSGCGTSCSISCGDGSSCTATCQPPRCARCSCPASCTCSF